MGAEKKWLFTLFSVAVLSLMLLLLSSFSTLKPFPSLVQHGFHYPLPFAYFNSSGHDGKDRVFRLLLVVYHPRNHICFISVWMLGMKRDRVGD